MRSGLILGVLAILNLETAFAADEASIPAQMPVQSTENIAELTAEQAAGQLLMIGFSGQELTLGLQNSLRAIQPGAVIFFQHNIGDGSRLTKLTASLQSLASKYSRLPLLTATDQEGGRVARMPFFPRLPSPLAIGRTEDPVLAKKIGAQVGTDLARVGINMNLAPVLDTLSGPDRVSFIGERAFGWDPGLVGQMGIAFAEGLRSVNVIPTAKHYPGSGESIGDPHAHAVSGDASDKDLLPFTEFISGTPSAIMLSHLSYPKMDKSKTPATFSIPILKKLRQDLKYEGLVLTDDMPMGALQKFGDLANLCVRAIRAGVDMVMISWGPREQIAVKRRLADAIRRGEIPRADLLQHLSRIAKLKQFLLEHTTRTPANSADWPALEAEVLQKNLNGDFAKLSSRPRGVLWGAISNHSDFLRGFFKGLGQRSRISSVALLQKPQYENLFWLVEVDSPRMALDIKSLSSAVRKRLLIVNELGPGWVDHQLFYGVLNLYHHHAGAGFAIGMRLKEGLKTAAISEPPN